MDRQMERHEEVPDSTERHTFGNRYHTFNIIGIESDKNTIVVLTGKVISLLLIPYLCQLLSEYLAP